MTMSNPIFVLPQTIDPQGRLEALEQELAACAQTLDDGEVPRMDGIEKEVALLCEQVMHMPAGEAGYYIQRLQALSDAFAALGEVMAAQRDAIKDEMGDLQARQKAVRAYGMQSITAESAAKKDDGQE